ncbi:MAG TPA: MMPL family transporter [Thermoanaerobaculia bacterium]|nr:MMPL family transporter [Thermoanaerobaculia bacterium]
MKASRLAEPVIRRPGLVLLAVLAVTLLAVIPALRFRVDTDLSALLPDGAPAADDYRLFLRTFGGFEKVFVLVRSKQPLEDPSILIDAAEVLAGEMGRSPEVAEARAGITEEDERFFLGSIAPRMALLAEEDVYRELGPRLHPDAIHERVAFMRQTLRSPAGSALAPLFAADPLGLSEGLIGAASAALPVDPLTGAFVSRKGDAALVILTPSRAEIDPEGGRALLADLEKAYAKAREAVDVPIDTSLEMVAVGGPIYASQDETILRADLSRTAAGSAAGVAILLLIGFGGGFIPLVILACVLAGLVWTAAIAALWLGNITVIGVGFAAALIGMGVEYGIHGGARFRQLRYDGLDVADALRETFRDPGPGIVSSALTTAAGLGALVLAHFRPLRELGQVLTVGVLVTLITTATLGAAMFVLFPKGVRLQRQALFWRQWGHPVLGWTVGVAARRPIAILVGSAVLTAASIWGLTRLELSTDLRSLRPSDHPSARAEQLLVETFSLGLDTFSVVAQGKDLGEALDRAAEARRVLKARLGPSAEITSPSDWLVEGERLRRRLGELKTLPLERAADDFERELAAAGFRLEPFAPSLAAMRAFGRGEDPGAPPPASWPRWVRELVRSGPEGTAVAVHVRVPLGGADSASAEALARHLEEASPGLALASIPRVGAELRGLAMGDLKRSSAVALALVALVVIVSVGGRIGDSLLSGLPLALGCVWSFGLWGAFGGHVDVLAISTLPVLFGTGIDLGVHAVHGGRLRPDEGIRGTVERSGRAMILIALTTGIGFGSLGSSRVPGLRNAGSLVAVGVTACLIATFLVLPALEALLRRRRIGENHGTGSDGTEA